MRAPLALLALALVAPSVARADPPTARQMDLPPFSLFDADTLGANRLAFGFGAGFPYVQAMAGYNVIDGLDADLNIDSLYGLVTVFSLGPKVRLVHSSGFALAVEGQGQAAWFRQGESFDQGSRQVTGVRNFDFSAEAIASFKGHYGSVFGTFQYQGTFDTEPTSSGPLTGTPGAWTYGSNLGGHVGLEFMAFGMVHPYVTVGLDLHTRSGDDLIMFYAEFGFTFPS